MGSALKETSPSPMVTAQMLISAGRAEEALVQLDRLLEREPRYVEALVQRSLVMILLARYEEALASADLALKISRAHPNAHSYRGSALLSLGQAEAALKAYDQVIALAPQAAVAHYNRANALRRLGRWQDALSSLEAALQLKPAYPDALTLAGIIMQSAGDLAMAMQCFDEALRLQPKAADAHYNRGLLLLALGHFDQGWDGYAWRLQWGPAVRQGQSRPIARVAPEWDGGALDRSLLVLPEQGIGDQIFYAGMLGDLEARLPDAVVCTEPRLLPLMARSFSKLRFTTPDQLPLQDQGFGAQIHIGSLGRIFRRQAADLARVRAAYLQADTSRTSALRSRVRTPQKITCGLSWVSKNQEFGRNKSLSLDMLSSMLALPGVDFVDLQYGDTTAEREALAAAHGLSLRKLDDIDNFHDIDGLASLIGACDIVVTVSNTTAHLAAALGKPVLVLVPATSSLFWYWHIDRADSPWYPTAVLLRQTADGDWSAALATATAALAEFIKASQS